MRETREFGGRMIEVDRSRDELLPDFSRATLDDRYLLPGESYQDMFARVAAAFSDDDEHAQRMYNYMSKLWFMGSTPVLSNGGAGRGAPISCFLSETDDSLRGISDLWTENVWLASNGGGIGNYWGNLRSIGETIGRAGQTSGIIPFIKVTDSQTLAISQGSLRRGSAAAYLDVWHPEIEEFLEIRKPTGDANRRSLNLHHGVIVSDEFMRAVESGSEFALRSPKDKSVIKTVDARTIWAKLLQMRVETGEPYILFGDTVSRGRPEHHKSLGLEVHTSNLCVEITLPTGRDHRGKHRTAVCCLSSLNLEKWDEWGDDPAVIEDALRFLDNVLQSFIDKSIPGMERAVYAAAAERSVGLGVMGLHGWLQKNNVPWESAMAKSWNLRIFKRIKEQCDLANRRLALEKGACQDSIDAGDPEPRRFSNCTAIAPTASISIIAGNSTPGVETTVANAFVQKTLAGAHLVKNKVLEELLETKGKNTPDVWSSIIAENGSVQHLDFLDDWERDVFKTSVEIDQLWTIEHAADRTPYVDQSQSINVFVRPDISRARLHLIHYSAWKKGMKSLYYCRSESVGRANIGKHVERENMEAQPEAQPEALKFEECLSCQ